MSPIKNLFGGVFDIIDADFIPKPSKESLKNYQKIQNWTTILYIYRDIIEIKIEWKRFGLLRRILLNLLVNFINIKLMTTIFKGDK